MARQSIARRRWTVLPLILGLAFGTASCASGDESGITGDDIAGFEPTPGRFSYGQRMTMIAGEAYQSSWPSAGDAVFEPVACLTYLAASEGLLATDESETSQDHLAFLQGAAASGSDGTDFVGLYAKLRAFSSTSAAEDFVSNLRTLAGPCAGGYFYTSEGFNWRVASIGVSQVEFDGVGRVLVLDETDLVVEYGGEVVEAYPHYTHYVYSTENAVIVASYIVSTGVVDDEDPAALLREFVSQMG